MANSTSSVPVASSGRHAFIAAAIGFDSATMKIILGSVFLFISLRGKQKQKRSTMYYLCVCVCVWTSTSAVFSTLAVPPRRNSLLSFPSFPSDYGKLDPHHPLFILITV